MKKSFLLSTVLLLAFFIQAQNYESIKNMVILQQFKKAKEDLDKGMANAKFNSKPEAYILKATIYAGMANDAMTKNTPAGEQYVTEAEAAFNKYREMDPALSLVTDPVYQNGPINIYSFLFSSGYKDYESKNWQVGFQKFKKVIEYSDILIAKKVIPTTLDTNCLLLAGITAENAGMKDEAAKYYSRIADTKAGGSGFEGIYRFLVSHYATKKDMVNFEKYRAYGKELYPNNEFFTYDKVDFAIGLEDDFNKRIAALEETIAGDPTNYKAIMLIGELIYDTLNSRKDDAVQPANAAELEAKMNKAFYRANELKPEDEMPLLYIADNIINKSVKINEARDKHVNEMKARTKPGTQSSKEDIAKRDALDLQYANTYTAAREPYEKAADIFAKKPKPLSGADIQRYKNVAGYLAEIATFRKNKAKANPADLAKLTAEEKKWNDLYDEVNKMKAKPKE